MKRPAHTPPAACDRTDRPTTAGGHEQHAERRPTATGHLRRRLERAGAERGQSLLLIVGAMAVVLAVAALAIDVSSWYQTHHKAQVASDAAAIAAANCEATGICASDAAATTMAQNYVKTNAGIDLPASDITIANKTVTVTTPLATHSGFMAAVASSLANLTATASAKATWNTYGSDCGSRTNACAFIFANDNSCSGPGVKLNLSGTGSNPATLNGTIISNSNISLSTNGNPPVNSAATSSDASGCTTSTSGHSTFTGTSTYTVPTDWPNDWPIDYRKIYTPCGSGYAYTCNSSGTPSYCTYSAASFNPPNQGDGIYCAYGTSTTKSDPSTWNGTISVDTAMNNANATFIGGTISIPSTITLNPAAGATMLAYANGSGNSSSSCSSNALCVSGNGATGSIGGDVFVPNGGASFNLGGNETYTGFIEAYDAYYTSHGNDVGQGPVSPPGGGPPQPPIDALIG